MYRNFPDAAALDCFFSGYFGRVIPRKQGSYKLALLFQSSLQKGVKVCATPDIFMIAKEQESNGRPFWVLFKD